MTESSDETLIFPVLQTAMLIPIVHQCIICTEFIDNTNSKTTRISSNLPDASRVFGEL